MHPLFILSVVFSWLIALVWTERVLSVARNLPGVPNLLDQPNAPAPCPLHPAPCITVIVPARNEAAAIEATLRSLLAQTIPLEILAVDDRSTDGTGVLMDRIAAETPPAGKYLSVIHIDALPAGWLGKPHAMALAARQAATPWLLFTDGDIVFREDTLERALRYAQDAADHLVLLPTLILNTAGESMMAAIFQSLTLLAWRPWKIADPRARRESIGMGAFNLVRSDVYRAVGGFEAAPLEVLEDLRLGYAIKRSGYPATLRSRSRTHPGALGARRLRDGPQSHEKHLRHLPLPALVAARRMARAVPAVLCSAGGARRPVADSLRRRRVPGDDRRRFTRSPLATTTVSASDTSSPSPSRLLWFCTRCCVPPWSRCCAAAWSGAGPSIRSTSCGATPGRCGRFKRTRYD